MASVLALLMALTTKNMTNATITKLMLIVMKLPYEITAPCCFAASRLVAVTASDNWFEADAKIRPLRSYIKRWWQDTGKREEIMD